MPIKGELRDFSTTQLLNLINLAKKTGTLTIFQASRPGVMEEVNGKKREKIEAGPERARVSFKGGKLIYASMDTSDGSLVSILNKAGKLTDDQARIIRERAKNSADKALAVLLINANYVSQADVVNSIQDHVVKVVYSLMSWKEEPFRFEDEVLPDKDKIVVPIDLENVILEGVKQLQQVEELNQHLPNLDMALRFPDNPKEKFKGIHLNVEEWRVVSYINPKNSIRQIAKANNMSETDIRRIVYGLEQAGLIEVIKPPGMEQATQTRTRPRPQQKPQVQKVVVSRLIDKIRSI